MKKTLVHFHIFSKVDIDLFFRLIQAIKEVDSLKLEIYFLSFVSDFVVPMFFVM